MNLVENDPSIIGLIPQSWYFDLMTQKNFRPYTSEWFFEPTLGWLFSNPAVFPYFFQARSNSWLYFQSMEDIPRFYNYEKKMWISLNP